MLLLNGIKFNPNTPFEVDGVQYPSNWFATASVEEKTALGITEVPDAVRPDDRFFYVEENADGTFTSTPKDLTPIKEQFKNDVDVNCGNVREAVVSRGDFIAEEYRVAYEEAVAFKNASYLGTPPASIQTWAVVKNQTPQWAADDVIATRDQYVTLLNAIRDVRLKSKAAIDAATTPDEILAAFADANVAIAAIK